jgi:hypothetical protein
MRCGEKQRREIKAGGDDGAGQARKDSAAIALCRPACAGPGEALPSFAHISGGGKT